MEARTSWGLFPQPLLHPPALTVFPQISSSITKFLTYRNMIKPRTCLTVYKEWSDRPTQTQSSSLQLPGQTLRRHLKKSERRSPAATSDSTHTQPWGRRPVQPRPVWEGPRLKPPPLRIQRPKSSRSVDKSPTGPGFRLPPPAPVLVDAASQASPGADRSFFIHSCPVTPARQDGGLWSYLHPSTTTDNRVLVKNRGPQPLAAPESHAAHGPATSLISPHPPTFPVPFSQRQPHSLPLSFKCTRYLQPRLGDTVLVVPA